MISNEPTAFQKVTLVPTESLRRLRQHQTTTTSAEAPMADSEVAAAPERLPPTPPPPPPLTVADPVIEKEAGAELRTFKTLSQEQASRMLELLPKGPMQNRARVLLNYLIGRVHLNDNQHINYPDLMIGSNLFDLLRWTVLPLPPRGRSDKSTQPLDVVHFATFLHKLGDVPRYGMPRLLQLFKLIDDGDKQLKVEVNDNAKNSLQPPQLSNISVKQDKKNIKSKSPRKVFAQRRASKMAAFRWA